MLMDQLKLKRQVTRLKQVVFGARGLRKDAKDPWHRGNACEDSQSWYEGWDFSGFCLANEKECLLSEIKPQSEELTEIQIIVSTTLLPSLKATSMNTRGALSTTPNATRLV